MRTTIVAIGVLILCAMLMIGCGSDQEPRNPMEESGPYIVVVNNPLLYFTQRLIGDAVDVRLLAPADIDPASWRPTVADVLQLQGAELVLLNGAAYSGWLNKVAISSSNLLVTSENARGQWIELDGQVTHSHGPGGEHAHGGYAFTTWMDMAMARIQAESIATALQQRWPAYRDAISANLLELVNDLDSLDRAYREQAAHLVGRDIIYSHPVYQYFERRYQLPGQSLHWEPDTMPADEQWGALQQKMNASSLFVWEAQPNAPIIERMTQLGLAWVVIDPAANTSENDWLSVQEDNIRRMADMPPR